MKTDLPLDPSPLERHQRKMGARFVLTDARDTSVGLLRQIVEAMETGNLVALAGLHEEAADLLRRVDRAEALLHALQRKEAA